MMFTVCAWCNRIRINGEWVVDDEPDRAELVSHGICESCAEKLEDEQPPDMGDKGGMR